MSTTKVKIRNGKIIGLDSRYIEFNKLPRIQYIKANGWVVYRDHTKALVARVSKEYKKTGISSVRCTIFPDGVMKVTSRKNDGSIEVVSKKKLADTIDRINGELILSGGIVGERYVTFRNEKICSFLEEFGLANIYNTDPNGNYKPEFIKDDANYRQIITDGKLVQTDIEATVSDASWVIVTEKITEGVKETHRSVLYTQMSLDEFRKLFR